MTSSVQLLDVAVVLWSIADVAADVMLWDPGSAAKWTVRVEIGSVGVDDAPGWGLLAAACPVGVSS